MLVNYITLIKSFKININGPVIIDIYRKDKQLHRAVWKENE